jgi:hypothetical protein
MRNLSILAVLASMAIAVPALAQNGNSANTRREMNGHLAMSSHMNMRHNDGQRQHALGSMRHPTVGNTANQRVNGG